jgi:hypothetical protein
MLPRGFSQLLQRAWPVKNYFSTAREVPILMGICPYFEVLSIFMPIKNFCPSNAHFLKIWIKEESYSNL